MWTVWGWRLAAALGLIAMTAAPAPGHAGPASPAPGHAGPASPAPAREAHVWVELQTGLAIGGYDPLSYFVDGAPRPGRREYETVWAGATWRFVSAGNRAAFLDHPEVYAPRFGGYSPPGVAEGAAVRGNPLIWTIHDERLYLFYSPVHKLMWQHNQARLTAAAEARWPDVLRTLAD